MKVFIYIDVENGAGYAYDSIEALKAHHPSFDISERNRDGDPVVKGSSGRYLGFIQERYLNTV